MNPSQQTEITQRARKADLLGLKSACLEFQAKTIEIQSIKAIIQNKPFQTPAKEAKTFKKQLEEMQTELFFLNQALTKMIKKLKTENEQ